jgi:signal transduction histidine kinase
VRIEATLAPAGIDGEPRLIERLVTNLVDNAVRHNGPDGAVSVHTAMVAGHPTLRVANTGPVIPPGEVERLVQPFQRFSPDGADRAGAHEGLGLGLSIVHAIAGAHGATLFVHAQAAGGLLVEVTFPAAAPTMSAPPAGRRVEAAMTTPL